MLLVLMVMAHFLMAIGRLNNGPTYGSNWALTRTLSLLEVFLVLASAFGVSNSKMRVLLYIKTTMALSLLSIANQLNHLQLKPF